MTTMTSRRLVVDVHADAVAAGAAVARRVVDLVRSRPRAVVGVATGSTMEPVYAQLARIVAREGVDLRGVQWFALDEYVGLPPGHPESYREVLARQLVAPLGLDPSAVHVPGAGPRGETEPPQEYDARIAEAGGVDLQLLGIGRNGHLAFNEPGTPFDTPTHRVRLTASTREANRRFFPGAEPPQEAITQGLGTIGAARELELVALGPAKAAALRDALDGPVGPDCPASLLQRHPCARVSADPAAAALLAG